MPRNKNNKIKIFHRRKYRKILSVFEIKKEKKGGKLMIKQPQYD